MKFPEPSLSVFHLDEPELDFRFGQRSRHPKDGLFLYGPHGATRRVRQVRIGVIGTRNGLAHFRAWSRDLLAGIAVPPPGKTEKKDRLHLADFAGLRETFGIAFDPDHVKALEVEFDAIERATRIENPHEAVNAVARLYTDRVDRYLRNEENPVDMWAFVVPEIVYERCRPEARRAGLELTPGKALKKKRARSQQGSLHLNEHFEPSLEDLFDDVPDFRRHIKARLLSVAPSQILRESTLAPGAFLNQAGYPKRKTQDPATVAWNLATGLYYKTQGDPPWRLSDVRDGVCYVGLVYKKLPGDQTDNVCCAAQMFLSEGDGVVFRGANGPWQTGKHEFHLSAVAAEELLVTVIEAFTEKRGHPPKELFLHGQTSFRHDEWEAFCRAAPPGTNVIGVRIRPTDGDTKLFRQGDYPVLRGTALQLGERDALLWTSGYVPQLDTYIGPETPNPLSVTILKAKYQRPEMLSVLHDIMGLTKINYNSCNFNDGLPVTVRFAKMIGEILVMGSARERAPQPFKYYI